MRTDGERSPGRMRGEFLRSWTRSAEGSDDDAVVKDFRGALDDNSHRHDKECKLEKLKRERLQKGIEVRQGGRDDGGEQGTTGVRIKKPP